MKQNSWKLFKKRVAWIKTFIFICLDARTIRSIFFSCVYLLFILCGFRFQLCVVIAYFSTSSDSCYFATILCFCSSLLLDFKYMRWDLNENQLFINSAAATYFIGNRNSFILLVLQMKICSSFVCAILIYLESYSPNMNLILESTSHRIFIMHQQNSENLSL